GSILTAGRFATAWVTVSLMRRAPPGTTLVQPLGAGSVFDVALVRDRGGRLIVAKRVAPSLKSRPEGLQALDRERLILATLGGTALPVRHGAGADDAGSYLLESRAQGTPVRELLDDGPLRANAWLRIARAASHALARVHEAADGEGLFEFVHGDVSPDNLFVHDDEAELIDLSGATFRLAREPVFADARGTLPYAAPEMVRGGLFPEAMGDVYALAATLLSLAVGPIVSAETEAAR